MAMLVPVRGTGVSGAVGAPFPAPQALCGALQPGRRHRGSILHKSWAEEPSWQLLPQHRPQRHAELGAGEVTLSCQGGGETI